MRAKIKECVSEIKGLRIILQVRLEHQIDDSNEYIYPCSRCITKAVAMFAVFLIDLHSRQLHPNRPRAYSDAYRKVCWCATCDRESSSSSYLEEEHLLKVQYSRRHMDPGTMKVTISL